MRLSTHFRFSVSQLSNTYYQLSCQVIRINLAFQSALKTANYWLLLNNHMPVWLINLEQKKIPMQK